MKEYLKNLKVGKKLKLAFGIILIVFIFTVVSAMISVSIVVYNVRNFYSKPYVNIKMQLEIKEDIESIEKNVLLSMLTINTQETENYIERANEHIQDIENNIEVLEKKFYQ